MTCLKHELIGMGMYHNHQGSINGVEERTGNLDFETRTDTKSHEVSYGDQFGNTELPSHHQSDRKMSYLNLWPVRWQTFNPFDNFRSGHVKLSCVDILRLRIIKMELEYKTTYAF